MLVVVARNLPLGDSVAESNYELRNRSSMLVWAQAPVLASASERAAAAQPNLLFARVLSMLFLLLNFLV
jgi:hypothetical protein